MANINDSLNELKNSIVGSNQAVSAFRTQNTQFKEGLLAKIQAVLAQIQGIANNPNIQNMRAVQTQLAETQAQLADSRTQLDTANTSLNQIQNQIATLQQEKQALEEQLRRTNDEKGQITQQLQDCQNQLQAAQNSQADIIQNIAQVNGVLAQQIQNINEMLNDANGYNINYDQQIDVIASNLQAVVNLLNGPNNPQPGGSRRKRQIKTRKIKSRNKKGGYNWSSRASASSSGSSRKRRTIKRRQTVV